MLQAAGSDETNERTKEPINPMITSRRYINGRSGMNHQEGRECLVCHNITHVQYRQVGESRYRHELRVPFSRSAIDGFAQAVRGLTISDIFRLPSHFEV